MDYILSNRWLSWLIGAHLWCMLGNSSTKQTTITTEYANSFNRSDSYASSVTTGDTSLSLGGTAGSGNTVTDYFFLVVGLLGVLGGLLIFNK